MINKNSLKDFLSYIGIFTVFFSLFLSWHLTTPNLTGRDDPYYHAKHALLVEESGTWSVPQQSVAYQYPVDAYVLAHLLMSTFIRLFGAITGTKIFAALQAALVFVIFFFVAKRNHVRKPFLWTVLFALASTTFITRLLFERPFVLSIVFLILGFEYTRTKKYFWLGLLSFVYILYYNLAPLIIGLALVSILIDLIKKDTVDIKPLIATLGGVTAGILIHPLRDNYIWHMSVHFFWVFGLKISGIKLDSGAEIDTQTFQNFFIHNILLITLMIIALSLFLFLQKQRQINRDILMLSVLSLPWFLIAAFIPRGLEYATPFGCLFTALLCNRFIELGYWEKITTRLKQTYFYWPVYFLAPIALVIISGITLVSDTISMRGRIKTQTIENFRLANEYLIAHTKKDAIIFNTKWDFFPLMFYFNTHNRYVMGFDPAFLYVYNPNMFWIHWHASYFGKYCPTKTCTTDLSEDKNAHALALDIHNVFQSDDIILDKKPNALLKILESNPKYFTLTYSNSSVAIYHLNNIR
jgi:hypothetical protein